jgi:hypothetical protein
MQDISFKRHRFPPEFIRHAVWLYARFTLSYRDVEVRSRSELARRLEDPLLARPGHSSDWAIKPVGTEN